MAQFLSNDRTWGYHTLISLLKQMSACPHLTIDSEPLYYAQSSYI